MKKLLLLLLALAPSISALDPIEKAIRESDPEQLMIALPNKTPEKIGLTQQRISHYIDLAETIIAKRQTTVYCDSLNTKRSPKIPLAAFIAVMGMGLPVFKGLFTGDHLISKSDQQLFAIVRPTSFIISCILFCMGLAEEKEEKQRNIQLYDNAIEIKQILRNA